MATHDDIALDEEFAQASLRGSLLRRLFAYTRFVPPRVRIRTPRVPIRLSTVSMATTTLELSLLIDILAHHVRLYL